MARRLQLHEKLCEILGSRNVYFQPPASIKMEYDCFRYKITDRDDIRADDMRYRNLEEYELLFITRDPDSPIPNRLYEEFRYISSGKPYTVDNLHHTPFTIYY